MHKKFGLDNRKNGDHVSPRIKGKCNIKMDLKEINVRVLLLQYIT